MKSTGKFLLGVESMNLGSFCIESMNLGSFCRASKV
jgi:hypothetical protein